MSRCMAGARGEDSYIDEVQIQLQSQCCRGLWDNCQTVCLAVSLHTCCGILWLKQETLNSLPASYFVYKGHSSFHMEDAAKSPLVAPCTAVGRGLFKLRSAGLLVLCTAPIIPLATRGTGSLLVLPADAVLPDYFSKLHPWAFEFL